VRNREILKSLLDANERRTEGIAYIAARHFRAPALIAFALIVRTEKIMSEQSESLEAACSLDELRQEIVWIEEELTADAELNGCREWDLVKDRHADNLDKLEELKALILENAEVSDEDRSTDLLKGEEYE